MLVGLHGSKLHAWELRLKFAEDGRESHRESIVVSGDAHDLLEKRGLNVLFERKRLDVAHDAFRAVAASGGGRRLHEGARAHEERISPGFAQPCELAVGG